MSTLGLVPDILADRPDLLGRLKLLVERVEDGRLDPCILDLCRRVGTLLGCPAHRGTVPLAAEFDERQRACLGFAEQFVLDAHSVPDEDARRMTEHLTDAEAVARWRPVSGGKSVTDMSSWWAC